MINENISENIRNNMWRCKTIIKTILYLFWTGNGLRTEGIICREVEEKKESFYVMEVGGVVLAYGP